MSYQDWCDSDVSNYNYEAQTGQSSSGYSGSSGGYGSGYSGSSGSYPGSSGGYSNSSRYSTRPSGGYSDHASGYSGSSGSYPGSPSGYSNSPSYSTRPSGGGGGYSDKCVTQPSYNEANDLLYKEHKKPNVYTGRDRAELQKIKHANDKPAPANKFQKGNQYYGDDNKDKEAQAFMAKLRAQGKVFNK
jgi:hypothetical protein